MKNKKKLNKERKAMIITAIFVPFGSVFVAAYLLGKLIKGKEKEKGVNSEGS